MAERLSRQLRKNSELSLMNGFHVGCFLRVLSGPHLLVNMQIFGVCVGVALRLSVSLCEFNFISSE